MQEIGVESDQLNEIVLGRKTIEARLGKPKFLKFRIGDQISLREDIWENNKIVNSIHNQAIIRITQLLYFESFEELFSAVSYKKAIPAAQNLKEALDIYRKFYSAEDEEKYGVISITFKVEE